MLVAASDRSDPVLSGFYKDIHAHPELAMQEERTSAKAAEWLEVEIGTFLDEVDRQIEELRADRL